MNSHLFAHIYIKKIFHVCRSTDGETRYWFVTLSCFYKQPVLAWLIAKQLSALNPFSLSNMKNSRLKKNRAFPLQKPDNTPKFSCLKNSFGKILKSEIWNVDFESWSYCIPGKHRLLIQTTKQPLSNFEPNKTWKY